MRRLRVGRRMLHWTLNGSKGTERVASSVMEVCESEYICQCSAGEKTPRPVSVTLQPGNDTSTPLSALLSWPLLCGCENTSPLPLFPPLSSLGVAGPFHPLLGHLTVYTDFPVRNVAGQGRLHHLMKC